MSPPSHPIGTTLANTVGFELLGEALGRDVESALTYALAGGAVLPGGADAIAIFRAVLADSIRGIQTHERGKLFQRLLREGPYEHDGVIPPDLQGQRLTDEETGAAITFIYSFMVNSFKGAVTELLAAGACQRLVEALRRDGELPLDATLFVGDTVLAHRKSGVGVLKAADLHILTISPRASSGPCVDVAGVVEVKSGRKSPAAMSRQLDRHIHRAKYGLRVARVEYRGEKIRLGFGTGRRIVRITVQPSDWKLSRVFWFEESKGRKFLRTGPASPPMERDTFTPLAEDRWHISLRWSKEAIAQAAHEMTFWYMEKVGEIIFAHKQDMPKDWKEMKPSEAGRNAVKMMLYYAIHHYVLKEQEGTLNSRESRVKQRAIALYNSYGFGYALGMKFRDADGRRDMLWPQDLDEILVAGKTQHGAKIKGWRTNRKPATDPSNASRPTASGSPASPASIPKSSKIVPPGKRNRSRNT